MKFGLLILIIVSFSCGPKPKELLRFVNDQNDAFNAFNISIFSDSNYEKSEFLSEEGGTYSLTNEAIYFKTGPLQDNKLRFTNDNLGCVKASQLVYVNHTTTMRTILDSLYCLNHQ